MLGNVRYYEPTCEGETALLMDGVLQTFDDFCKFQILDYCTSSGIDLLVREDFTVPIENDYTVGYVELKHNMNRSTINHSFSKLRGIVMYDKKGLKLSDIVVDLRGKRLMVQKVNGSLVLADHFGEVGHSLALYIIKDYLESKGKYMS